VDEKQMYETRKMLPGKDNEACVCCGLRPAVDGPGWKD